MLHLKPFATAHKHGINLYLEQQIHLVRLDNCTFQVRHNSIRSLLCFKKNLSSHIIEIS